MTSILERQPAIVDPAERALRVELAAAYRLVAHFGWDDLVFTHLSARIPGPEHHFLINRYGLMFEEITASSLVRVDMDGNVVDGSGALVNPAGFTIHSAVHMARPDATCVIHLHTICGTAVSCLAEGLLPINQTAMLLNGRLAYHDFEGIALDHDERPRLIADLGDKAALILRSHGTLTVGASVGQAFTTMYLLERACAMQVAVQGSGTIVTPALPVQQVVAGQAGVAGSARFVDGVVWPALLRLLDRHHPGYAD